MVASTETKSPLSTDAEDGSSAHVFTRTSVRRLVAMDGSTEGSTEDCPGCKRKYKRSMPTEDEQELKYYRRILREHRKSTDSLLGGRFGNLADVNDAVLNGDISAAQAYAKSMLLKHSRSETKFHDQTGNGSGRESSRRRRRRRLQKQDLCINLSKCASRMSKYDMFVYFNSDDIDPVTGDVDENVLKYDEENLDEKYEKIKDLATAIGDPEPYSSQQESCDGDTRITSVLECKRAGLMFGGKTGVNGTIAMGEGPCGCSVISGGRISLNQRFGKACTYSGGRGQARRQLPRIPSFVSNTSPGTGAKPKILCHNRPHQDCDELLRQFHRVSMRGCAMFLMGYALTVVSSCHFEDQRIWRYSDLGRRYGESGLRS